MSEDVRQKIIDVICEEWPTPDGYLLGSDIYEPSEGRASTSPTTTCTTSSQSWRGVGG